MSLVSAELRRLYKRRVTRWMFVVVVLVLAAIAAMVALSNQQHGPDTVAAAEAAAQREYEEQLRWHNENVDRQVAECEADQASDRAEEFRAWPDDFDCEEIRDWVPQREHFEAEWHMPPTFHFRDQFRNMITAFAGLLALFGFIVGASFVGAEWRSGGMMNLLLWRPRRLQVLGAKLGTLLLGVLGLGVVLGAVWTAVFWLIGTYRGVTDTMTSGVWQSFALTGLRGIVLMLAAGALGFALASIGRHTAMALGAAVAAVVVGVVGVSIAVYAIGVRYAEAWLWITHVRAWMEGSVTLQDWRACQFSFGQCEPATLELTWQTSGLGLAAVAAVVLGAAVWHMRSRDVT